MNPEGGLSKVTSLTLKGIFSFFKLQSLSTKLDEATFFSETPKNETLCLLRQRVGAQAPTRGTSTRQVSCVCGRHVGMRADTDQGRLGPGNLMTRWDLVFRNEFTQHLEKRAAINR